MYAYKNYLVDDNPNILLMPLKIMENTLIWLIGGSWLQQDAMYAYHLFFLCLSYFGSPQLHYYIR